jgi:hypothetical protein
MAEIDNTSIISTPYDIPSPMVMALSRAPGQKPSGIDWSDFTAQLFEAIEDVLETYRDNPHSMATALRYLVQFVRIVQKCVYTQRFFAEYPYICQYRSNLDWILEKMRSTSRSDVRNRPDSAILGFDRFIAGNKKKSCLQGIHNCVNKHTKPYDLSVDPQGRSSLGPSQSLEATANLGFLSGF